MGRIEERMGVEPLAAKWRAFGWETLEIDGHAKELTIVKEMQRHPIKHYVQHVDFYAVSMTQLVRLQVPVVLDVVGVLMLVGGLVAGRHMSAAVGAGFLIAYYLLMIEIALATHTVGTFRISYWRFGPTELRILLAAGTLQLMRSDYVTIGGSSWLLFDVGAIAAIAGLVVTFIASVIANTRTLYAREPLPGRERPEGQPRTTPDDPRILRSVRMGARS